MTLVPARRRDEEFRDQVTTSIPGFAVSDQYRLLDSEDRKVPGLVFAALAAYVLTLQEHILKGGEAASFSPAIDRTLDVIEAMASSGDDVLTNLVVTEIFENWNQPEASEVLRHRLGPKADALFRRWLEGT